MSTAELVVATARAVRPRLAQLLSRSEARAADRELGRLLARADAGEDVTAELLDVLRRRDETRDAAFAFLRSERSGAGYQALLGVATRAGARYTCPVSGCGHTADRLDDSEPEPRCPVHSVRMQRI